MTSRVIAGIRTRILFPIWRLSWQPLLKLHCHFSQIRFLAVSDIWQFQCLPEYRGWWTPWRMNSSRGSSSRASLSSLPRLSVLRGLLLHLHSHRTAPVARNLDTLDRRSQCPSYYLEDRFTVEIVSSLDRKQEAHGAFILCVVICQIGTA